MPAEHKTRALPRLSLPRRRSEPADAHRRGTGSDDPRRGTWHRALTWLRAHALFLAFLLAGVALRAVTQASYRPALVFYDSRRYLDSIGPMDPGGYAPLGYPLLAKVVLHFVRDLAALATVNHLMALGLGVLLYVVMLRRDVPRWLAALACAPVLLDAYQLFLEQMVMSEILFETFIVLAAAALTWHRRPGYLAAVVAGLCFAAAGLTRYIGVPLVLAGVVFLLLAGGTLWRRLALAAVLAGCCALALGAYASYNKHLNGEFAVSSHTGSRSLYARVATFADCEGLALPAYERPLCPRPGVVAPVDGSLVEGYTFDPRSPAKHVVPPAGQTRAEVLDDFSKRVIRHQPWAFIGAVGADFVRPFIHWSRSRERGELPIERWRFNGYYPRYLYASRLIRRWGGARPAVDRELALAMRDYQVHIGYTPGVLLGAAGLLGLAGALDWSRRRGRSGLRAVCLLWTSTGLLTFLVAVVYQFSWRYFFPVVVTLPVAGAFGLTALFGRRSGDDPACGPPERSAGPPRGTPLQAAPPRGPS